VTYPSSSSINPGDPTLASQYNNLRADALYLGQTASNSIPLGKLLESYETNLKLQKLNTAQVVVPASSSAPVSLFIGGYLVQAIANVALDASSAPTESGTWYVFADRAANSTTFTLSISTSSAEGANQRRIGRFYFDGSAIVKDSVRSELSEYLSALLYALNPLEAGGRLTLASGSPIATDVSSATVLFYTPCVSNRITLYVPGYGWRLYSFAQLSFSLAGLSANRNYDIFIYNDDGELKLSALVWSNDTLRASAYTLKDGIPVMAGAEDHRYLGTLRTLATAGTSADCADKRFVWNMYNRSARILKKVESESSWTYAAAAWRPINNNADNKVEFVLGLTQDPLFLLHTGYVSNSSTGSSAVGIALDSSNVNNADLRVCTDVDNATIFAIYQKLVASGYHYLQLTEWMSGVGTSTFYGYNASYPSAAQWGGLGWLQA